MAGSNSSSWADQWDYDNPHPVLQSKKTTHNSGGGFSKKVGDGFQKTKVVASVGFDKTKVVASAGFKKVKEGSSVGFHWIKDKYQKTTHKH